MAISSSDTFLQIRRRLGFLNFRLQGIFMELRTIIFIVLAALLVFWTVGAYNRLVRYKNIIANAFGRFVAPGAGWAELRPHPAWRARADLMPAAASVCHAGTLAAARTQTFMHEAPPLRRCFESTAPKPWRHKPAVCRCRPSIARA